MCRCRSFTQPRQLHRRQRLPQLRLLSMLRWLQPAEEETAGTKVTAPLVGTFYAAPSPEEPPYIEVGQAVKKGDTLFIIEAMKTMNEISAPCDGTVSRIMAQSGDMVEYGQTLVVIA